MHISYRRGRTALITLWLGLSVVGLSSGADDSLVAPPTPSSGSFVDRYRYNTIDNNTPETNPSIALLSEFLLLWKPGTLWNSGTKLQSVVLDENIQKSIEITTQRTAEEALRVYLDDRRNQSYSIIEGFGPYADDYRTKAKAETTINEIASDASRKKDEDRGNGAGDRDSSLGSIVQLVEAFRGKYSSSNPAKYYFQYPRPFRWTENVILLPELLPERSGNPATDGGFPSGHTNAAYMTALAFAYSMPLRYQELLARASELGHDRILAGMHSTLDVMGGRMLATALAAAILNDPNNQSIKLTALKQAGTLVPNAVSSDRFADYAKNKQDYIKRLTGGFAQIGVTDKPMRVPKGAEVLLETRLPYLDSIQRRWVLFTTGLPSGYPTLDDAEGWGRLNLFAAADGYGALLQDVSVEMDVAKGGFHARDAWRNAISGPGKLIKTGSGVLRLTGDNTFTGGTWIDAGGLEACSANALGRGNVVVNGGTLSNLSPEPLTIEGDFVQKESGALELNLGANNSSVMIKGCAHLAGKLILNFTNRTIPKETVDLILYTSRQGEFDDVRIEGLSSRYTVKISYERDRVRAEIVSKKTISLRSTRLFSWVRFDFS